MYIPYFISLSMTTWIDSHLLAVVNDASMNMEYKYLFEILIFILLHEYPELGLLGHIVVLCFVFVYLFFSFLWHPYHFIFPANMHKCSYVSTLTPTLWTKLPFEMFIQVKRRVTWLKVVSWLKAQVVLGYHRSCEGHVLRSDSGPHWPGSELPMSLPPLWGHFSDSTTYNSPLLLQ